MHFSPFATVDDWSSPQKPQATGTMFPTSLALPTHPIHQQPPPTPTTLQGEGISSAPRNSHSFLDGSFQDDFLPYQSFQQFDDLAINTLHPSDKTPSHSSASPQIHQQQQQQLHHQQQQQAVQNSSWADQRYTQAYMPVTAAGTPISMGQPSYYAQHHHHQQQPTVHPRHHLHLMQQQQQQQQQQSTQQQHYHQTQHQQHFQQQQQQRSLPPSQHMPYPQQQQQQQQHHQMISHQQAFLNSLDPSQQQQQQHQQVHRQPPYPGVLSPQQQQQQQTASLSSPHKTGGKRKDIHDYMIESTISVPMKKPKKKKKKKEPEDPNAPPKPKRNTGLNKPLILSAELSILMGGEKELSRPEIVKRLWVHIKSNELQDPKDRRFILCDDKLKAIFHVDRVNSFGMNRDLSKHLTKKEEPAAGDPPSTENTEAEIVSTTTATTNNANIKHSPTVTADTPDDVVVTPQEGEHVHGPNNPPAPAPPSLASLTGMASSTTATSSTPLLH